MGFAQESYMMEKSKLIPASPNAASLGLYGAIPVGHYTGTPNISIPIYEIDLDGKKFPISLSYHASGIRVSQEASSVGLGWTLNAGGIISKSQRGLDDFNPENSANNGYYKDNKFPTNIGADNYPIMPINYENYRGYVEGSSDPEPDIFYFNFGNYSGRMFFKKGDPNGVIMDKKDYVSIIYSVSPNGNMFTAYDADGYAYYFGKRETTQTYSVVIPDNTNPPHLEYTRQTPRIFTNPDNFTPNISAWCLDSIVSPLKNKIAFSYTAENICTPTMVSEDTNLRIKMIIEGHEPINYPAQLRNFIYSYSKITQQRISSISFNGGTITFGGDKRVDLDYDAGINEPKRINKITVKNTINSTIIKDVNLNHSYLGNQSSYLNCRLLLDNIKELSGSTSASTHIFSYNKNELPAKNSLETDYWGFYNKGELQNPANTTFYTIPSVPTSLKPFFGRNKASNPAVMQNGILTSIQYPTGGTSGFTYETHQFNKRTFSEWSTGFAMASVSFHPFEKAYPPKKDYSESILVVPDPFDDGVTTIAIDFSVTTNKINVDDGFNPAIVSDRNRPNLNTLRIEKLINGAYTTNYKEYKQFDLNMTYVEAEDENKNKQLIYAKLSPGTYRLSLEVNPLTFTGFSARVSSTFLKEVIKEEIPNEAGLRIKEIKNISESGKEEYKYYDYTSPLTGYSSAILMTPPAHYRYLVFSQTTIHPLPIFGTTPGTPVGYIYLIGTTNSNIPVSNSAQGNPVGYSYVKEYTGANKNLGYSYFQFHNQSDDYKNSEDLPDYPSNTNPLNGYPIIFAVYNSSNQIQERKSYNYTLKEEEKIKGLKIYRPSIFSAPGGLWKFYDRISKRYVVDTEVVENYINGSLAQTQTINYGYANTYFLKNSVKTQDSKGQATEQTTKYPFDYTDAISKGMVTKNMVGIPIENISLINNSVVAASKTQFKDTLNTYLPTKMYSFKSLSPIALSSYSNYYKLDHMFTTYNAKGRLLESYNPDNTHTSYIWDANNLYPIAIVQNEKYDTAVKSFSGYNTTGTTIPNATTEATIRKNIPNALISTYTYKPLVGVTATTDPSGITTYYNYDAFGRLTETYIIEGGVKKVVQSYNYNYKNK